VKRSIAMRSLQTMGQVRLDDHSFRIFDCSTARLVRHAPVHDTRRGSGIAKNANAGQISTGAGAIWGMSE